MPDEPELIMLVLDDSRLRPCVRSYLKSGTQNDYDRKKLLHAIIYEMNRVQYGKAEIKQTLTEWNQRSRKPLSPEDAQRQLCDYVDWFLRNNCKYSCKALQSYCLYPTGGCAFQKKPRPIALPFSPVETWLRLEREYHSNGYTMTLVLRALIYEWKEKGCPPRLFAGVRRIRAIILDRERTTLSPATISRTVYRLSDIGILSVTKGEKGTFGTRRANEYEVLRWPPTDEQEHSDQQTAEQFYG